MSETRTIKIVWGRLFRDDVGIVPYKRAVTLYGHFLGADSISARLRAIHEWPRHNNKKDLRRGLLKDYPTNADIASAVRLICSSFEISGVPSPS